MSRVTKWIKLAISKWEKTIPEVYSIYAEEFEITDFDHRPIIIEENEINS